MKVKTVKHDNHRIYIGIGKYENGNIGLFADTYSEPYSDISINLPGYSLPYNEMFIDDMCKSCGLEQKLIEEGLFEKIRDEVKYNMGKYDLIKVNMEKLKEYDPEGFKKCYPNYDKSIQGVVNKYFAQYDIKNLMEYGSDRDSHNMPTITQMYKEILDKLNIEYNNIETEDISDGRYGTTIELKNGKTVNVSTDAWNNEDDIADNIEDICEEKEKIEEYSSSDDMEM